MRKSLIVAGSALFFSVGAAGIQAPRLGYDMSAFGAAAMGSLAAMHPGSGPHSAESHRTAAAPQRYRPCRRGAGDDRCIQLYERGVRLAYAQWLAGEDRFAEAAPATRQVVARRREVVLPYAMGGPIEHASGYPECLHSTRDDRCIQAGEYKLHDEPARHPRRDERMLDYGHDEEGTPGI